MSVSFFLLWLVSIPLIVHADVPAPRGFFLSCGASSDEVEVGSLKYRPDEGYISVGNKSSIEQPDLLPQLSTLRFFPDTSARKYCFTFPVIRGGKFLVKTIYYYGGFDGGKEPPVFDQIIDGTKWSTVNTTEDYANGLTSYYEIIVTAHAKELSVCLARNQHTLSSPFISAIELDFLDESLYNSTDFENYALTTVARHSFGYNGDIISFPDDQFNRFWQPFTDDNPVVTSHSNISPSEFWNTPPAKAITNAITTSRGKTLTVKWPPFPLPSTNYYIALYFQDNRTPSPYSWRVFNVTVNDNNFYTNLNATTNGVTVYATRWPLSGQTQIVMTPGTDMSVGPVINAGELFQILPFGGRTLTRDVSVMEDLARSFDNPPSDWSGDPCLPKQNSWTGVTCSGAGKYARVVSVNLTSAELSGTLPESIDKLTALTSLWLGGNHLSGPIPDMSSLKTLQTLHLENNKFEGSIPESLGKLPKLREIFLQNNMLNGSVPHTLTKRNGINIQISPGNNLSHTRRKQNAKEI
uniref:Malectin-like domain-containing protein n=1 Tax=Davidia involucrata TaxID=16924 RepID=A0A5B7BDL0_DAVIN